MKHLYKFLIPIIILSCSDIQNTQEQFTHPQKLIINKFENNIINKWDDSQKLALTYCISKSTCGHFYSRIINLMDEVTSEWEAAANINFIHLPEYDDNCDETTNEVLFDVRLRYGVTYEAKSFFPGQPRITRNIFINSGFVHKLNYLTGLLRHELRHVLGFRHEHIRPEANSPSKLCMDNNYGQWEALTEYDSNSVMHYTQCNGTAESFQLTDQDIKGARIIYGPPLENNWKTIGKQLENKIINFTFVNFMYGD